MLTPAKMVTFNDDALTVETGVTVHRNWKLQDLFNKKEESKRQGSFASKLAKQSKLVETALKKVKKGTDPTVPQLKALIESKGETPPVGNKPVLLEKWRELKDTPDWEQTVFFTS